MKNSTQRTSCVHNSKKSGSLSGIMQLSMAILFAFSITTQADGKDKPVTAEKSKSGIVVKGIHDVAVRFSKCCSPVPGDEIVGFVTRGRGVSIHRTDWPRLANSTSP